MWDQPTMQGSKSRNNTGTAIEADSAVPGKSHHTHGKRNSRYLEQPDNKIKNGSNKSSSLKNYSKCK